VLVHLHTLTIFTELPLSSAVSEIYTYVVSKRPRTRKPDRVPSIEKPGTRNPKKGTQDKTKNVPRITFEFEVSTTNVKRKAWQDFQILFLVLRVSKPKKTGARSAQARCAAKTH
jgi:hypothetical protein